jgi:hypothetical protein
MYLICLIRRMVISSRGIGWGHRLIEYSYWPIKSLLGERYVIYTCMYKYCQELSSSHYKSIICKDGITGRVIIFITKQDSGNRSSNSSSSCSLMNQARVTLFIYVQNQCLFQKRINREICFPRKCPKIDRLGAKTTNMQCDISSKFLLVISGLLHRQM